jgi:hypothetical protein
MIIFIAGLIGGWHSRWATAPEAAEQLPDGAGSKAEGRGDGGAILAVLETPPDGLADGYGEGARHGRSSIEARGQGCP